MARVIGVLGGDVLGGGGLRGSVSRSTKISFVAMAVAVFGSSVASAQDAYTTRIEPRPFYGATVTIEEGVRVFRPLPPHRQIIISPGQKTPLNLTFNETTERTYVGRSDVESDEGSGASVSADGAGGYASGGYVGDSSGGYARRAVGHNGRHGYKGLRLAGLGKHNVRVNGHAAGARQAHNSAHKLRVPSLSTGVGRYQATRFHGSGYQVGPRVNHTAARQRTTAPAYVPRTMMAPRAVHGPAHAAMGGRPMMMGRGRR
jgi:hypothetical protein